MAAEGSFAPTTKRWALFKALRREEGLDTPLEPIPKRRSTDPAPLSFAQQRLWFFDQLMPGNIVYNIPMALRILGPLNVTALQRSLGEIMNRHEALRTRFMSVEGRPIQVVSPAEAFTLPVIDLCHLADSERGVQEQRLAEEEAQRPFDLTRDPALRAKLLRLGEEHSVLLYSMHHIACDGWSMGVFTRELTELYDAFSRGRPPLLPELPIQYADFAVWQREWLTGEPLERQLEYWKRQLNGLAPLQLPEDRPRPAVLSFRGGRESLSLSPSLAKALRALSEREGVTLFMTLCAAFQTLLSRYTGQTDIAVGSPIANRNRTEIEGLIGFFVNTLVLRADLSGDPTFRELLGRVREVCLGAYTQQDLPFEKLVEELAPERTLSHTPLLQTMFVLQNVPKRAVELPGLQLTLSGVKTGTARFDLTAELIEEGEGLSCVFEYSTDLFDAPRIGRMLEHFHTLLKSIVTDPEERLSKFRLLIEPERRALLVEWNDTVAEYPNSACIHELFEAQVDRTPDAVAVVFEGRQLTYRELEARANQLARYLGKLGVGPDVLVGLCLERSLEMIVALLGVLKAGGAYVPLDPGYPEERLRFMLEDARAPVLL
ncbi:MAG TPA: condensation domain-containing protein, partial [Methylomirabilota bacterium]|nr:condensation domain-containing protein [Methylomirabilota bacterium]